MEGWRLQSLRGILWRVPHTGRGCARYLLYRSRDIEVYMSTYSSCAEVSSSSSYGSRLVVLDLSMDALLDRTSTVIELVAPDVETQPPLQGKHLLPSARRPGFRYAADRGWSDMMEHDTAASMHRSPSSRIGWHALLAPFLGLLDRALMRGSRSHRSSWPSVVLPASLLALPASPHCTEKWFAVARPCAAARYTSSRLAFT